MMVTVFVKNHNSPERIVRADLTPREAKRLREEYEAARRGSTAKPTGAFFGTANGRAAVFAFVYRNVRALA